MKTLALLALLSSSISFAAEYKFQGQEYPPFNYIEGGKTLGAMNDIVTEMCAITKDTCKLEIVPLKRAITGIESGEIHGVVALLKNAERDGFARFSPPIIKSDMILVTAGPVIAKNVSELKGWTIGAVTSSSSAKLASAAAAEAGDGAKVIEDSDNDTIVKKVSNNRYGDKGAIIINEDVLRYVSKKNNVSNLKPMFTVKSDDFGIYFSKKSVDDATLKKFSDALEQMKSSGAMKKILAKYEFKNK